MEDRGSLKREAIHLVKDFTMEHAWDEVEFYMGMVAKEEQSFKGLIDHLHDAFQLAETLSELISNFYGWYQKVRETKDTFADNLQVLARKIIACKLSFCKEANQQLRAQYDTNCGTSTMLQWPAAHCSPPWKRSHSLDFRDD